MTLNQVVNRIRIIGQSHGLVNLFFYGDPWELESQEAGAVTYPVFMVQLVQAQVNRSATRLDFAFYFMDQVTAEEHNETEVHSDMLGVAVDILAKMRDPNYDDWTVSDSNSGPFFTERLQSITAGLRIDVAVLIDDYGDRCAVPEKE